MSRTYFPNDAAAVAFNKAFLGILAGIQKQIVGQYLNHENTQRFRHGGAWMTPGSDAPAAQVQTHSAVLETRFEDVVNNDLAALERNFSHFREAMHKQFAETLYSSISKTCDRTGNIVDAQAEGSLEAAFIAVLEKIELGVDKDGTVSMPEIHVSPDVGDRMIAALESTSQEYKQRIEALKARKIAEAQAREAERKARFLRYGPEPCAS